MNKTYTANTKRYMPSLLAIAISASFLLPSGKAFATTCVTTSNSNNAHGEQDANATVTCTGINDDVFIGTIGNGPGNVGNPVRNNNVSVVIDSGSILDPGNTSAISLGNNGHITIKSGATVTNSAAPPTQGQPNNSGFWGVAGPNTIEFGNSTTLVIEAGATVSSYSLSSSAEAINVMGFGNHVINYGTIYSRSSAAIWFQDLPALENGIPEEDSINILDNYGVISSPNGQNVIGTSGTDSFSDLYFINRKGAVVNGNIFFAGGHNQLELYAGSTINGDIDGGSSGNNTITLTGNAGESQTFYGDLKNFQKLIKNGGATWDMEGDLGLNNTSAGLEIVVNSGTLIFGGSNVYSGDTTINGGVLATGHVNSLSDQSNIFIKNGGTLDIGGFSQTVPTIDNSGIIKLNAHADSGTPGAILTVTGDYTGNNGILQLSTYLHDDDSPTDMLWVEGNTSGLTFIRVINAGGSGAQTLNGIKLIHVDGESDGEFRTTYEPGNAFRTFRATDTVHRIVAGAYDYYLARGTIDEDDEKNWYLSSLTAADGGNVERPEANTYSANLAASNNMFVTRLQNRLGETQYIDAFTGETKVTSMWLRNVGGHNRFRDNHNQLSTQSNSYVLQLGGDIAQWSSNESDRFHLGLMAGYGNSKSRTTSNVSGYGSRGSVDGYSTGIYGTWYANEVDNIGLYVDTWAQYSWFNNTVDGQGLETEKYKSKGISASVENGYTFKLGDNASKTTEYFIQPKAQVTWMGVKADDHQEANHTHISSEGTNNIQTRLGVRTFMKLHSDQDKSKDRVFQPFVETNWIHNTKDFGTNMDGVTIKQDGAANIAELKMGVEGQLNKRVNLWANVAQQVGNKGYSDTTATLGIKFNF